MRRLHEARVITGQVSLLDPLAVGLGVTAFAHIRVDLGEADSLERFEAAVADVPQIMECYAVSGSWNFLLKIVAESVESYERLLKKKLIHLPGVSSLESTIALSRVKHTTRLPLASVMRTLRVTPTVEGPKAALIPAAPSAAMIASTLRKSALDVPMARISVPRSSPTANAGAFS